MMRNAQFKFGRYACAKTELILLYETDMEAQPGSPEVCNIGSFSCRVQFRSSRKNM